MHSNKSLPREVAVAHGIDLAVREIEHSDIEHIVKYWTESDPAFLRGMGVDLDKLPGRDQWVESLSRQIESDIEDKKAYALIWVVDDEPVGHCNVNQIEFGEHAHMHLHLWNRRFRKRGIGTELVRQSLPYFFERLQLKKLFCAPYALNLAPNKTLAKVGFKFLEQRKTTPGDINFEQVVNHWVMTRSDFLREMTRKPFS